MYCTYIQPTVLYCASSWISFLSENNLMKLDAQHPAGARVITGCTKSTPIQALLKEAGLLSISDQGDFAAARLRERALRDQQYTPIAQTAKWTKGSTVRGEVTRSTRSQVQGQRQHSRCSWCVAAEAFVKGAGLDTVTVEPTVQGPPWTDCSKVHFWPDLDEMAPTPSDSSGTISARLAAANRALATIPPADLHLWTDGSVAANNDDGAGFALFIHDKLRLSQAHPVGQGVAELRTEADTLRLGLQAVLDLQDYSTFQGIRVLTDSQSLVRHLASGPARQPDSICSTMWTLLSAASIQNTVDVQWIPANVGKEGNDLPTVRLSEVVLYLSQQLAWITPRHLQHSLTTNTPSPPQGKYLVDTLMLITGST